MYQAVNQFNHPLMRRGWGRGRKRPKGRRVKGRKGWMPKNRVISGLNRENEKHIKIIVLVVCVHAGSSLNNLYYVHFQCHFMVKYSHMVTMVYYYQQQVMLENGNISPSNYILQQRDRRSTWLGRL